MIRLKLSTIGRAAIALGAISILLYLVDLTELIDAVRSTNLQFFWLAVVCLVLNRFLVATRWWLFIVNSNQTTRWSKIVHAIFVSSFLGSFFPTGLGEDVFRVYYLDRSVGPRSQIFASVILDRLSGMVALGCLSLIGISYVFFQNTTLPIGGLAFLGAILMFGPIFLPVMARAAPRFKVFAKHLNKHNVVSFLADAATVVGKIRLNSRLAAMTLLISFLIQLGRCIMFYLLYVAIDSPVSLVEVIVLIPPVLLALVLPISFGGIGIREAGLSIMFAFIGISLEESISVGLLFYGAELISFSPGLILLVIGRRQ